MKKLLLILVSSGVLRASLDGWLFVWPAQYGYNPNIPYTRFFLRNTLPQGLTAKGAALMVTSKPGWLLGPEIGNWFYDQDILNGETRGIGTPESWGAVSGTGYGTTGSLIMRPFIRNGELPYDERMVISVLVGPPPPILTTEALDGKHIRLLCSYQDDRYDNHYVFWKNEKDKTFQQIQISGDPTQYTLHVPYSSTEYQIYAGGTWNSGVPGAPPYEGFSETATDTTFPHLSSRSWDFFSGPAQNKVVYDHENHRLYLVLVDQGKVWFSYSTTGGMSWSEHIPISGNIKNPGSPAIADFDGGVGVAFLGREPQSQRDNIIYYTYALDSDLNSWTSPTRTDPPQFEFFSADALSLMSSGNTAVVGTGQKTAHGDVVRVFSFEFRTPTQKTGLMSEDIGFNDIALAVSENGQGRLFVSDDFNIIIYGGPINGTWQSLGSVSAYIYEIKEPYLTATSTGDNFLAAVTTGSNQILIVHDASGWQTHTITRPDQIIPVSPHLSANGQGDFTLTWAENNNGKLEVWKADGTLNGGFSIGTPSKVTEASNSTVYGAYFLNPHGVRPFLDKILVFHEDTVSLPPYELRVRSMLEALLPPTDVVVQAISSEEIQVSWLNNCSAAYIKVEYAQERDGLPLPNWDEVPCTGKGTRQTHIISGLKPSTQYTVRLIAVDQQGEAPTVDYTATTHPLLSSRVDYSLDPSTSSKFVEKGDKVYLVHEDQDRIWLIMGTKDPGKGIAWDEREYLLSDLLPQAWDPCIGLAFLRFCGDASPFFTAPKPQVLAS